MELHRRPFRLREFKIELTYRCDLNCVHCSSDAHPSNSVEMTRRDCLRILEEAAGIGAEEVAFSGGEPLLWPHILMVVEAAAKHGMKVTLYTSGNAGGFKQQARRIWELGASCLIFSIFSATAAKHDRITRKAGSFERTKAAMRNAIAIGLTTELHYVPMSDNYRDLPDVAILAREIGASRMSILRLVPQGRAALMRNRILNRFQYLELRRQICTIRSEYGARFIRTGSPFNFLMLDERPACCAAIDRLIITPDLRIFPCDAFKRIQAFHLAKTDELSSLDAEKLATCWEKSPYLEAVRTYLTSDFGVPCDSCRFLEKCLSGCLAQKVIAFDSLDKKPDPDCLESCFRGDTL